MAWNSLKSWAYSSSMLAITGSCSGPAGANSGPSGAVPFAFVMIPAVLLAPCFLLCREPRVRVELLERIARGLHAILVPQLLRDRRGRLRQRRLVQHLAQLARNLLRRIARLLDHLCHTEPLHSPRIVRLVMRVRHDQHRLA